MHRELGARQDLRRAILDDGPHRRGTGCIEQIFGLVYFAVQVGQRPRGAAAQRKHGAVGQQNGRRMVEPRHCGVGLNGPVTGRWDPRFRRY